jgi:hypothetical protein
MSILDRYIKPRIETKLVLTRTRVSYSRSFASIRGRLSSPAFRLNSRHFRLQHPLLLGVTPQLQE